MSDRLQQLRDEDKASRRFAQVEYERPVVLEAGAGTGKTATLVARIVVWCMGAGWERARIAEARAQRGPEDIARIAARVMDRVIAITFTEAAAGEMASRVNEALVHVEQGEFPKGMEADCIIDGPERSIRARALLTATDHLFIRTIHAFCRRMLGNWPLEAGIHPDFDVDADGAEVESIVDLVVAERVRTAYAEPNADFLALADVGVGPSDIGQAVLEMINKGVSSDVFKNDPLPRDKVKKVWTELLQAATALARAEGGNLQKTKRSPKSFRTAAWVEKLSLCLQPVGEDAAALEQILKSDPPDEFLDRLEEWAEDTFTKSEIDAIGDTTGVQKAAARLHPLLLSLQHLDVVRIQSGRKVIGPLIAEVERRLRSQGILTFSDLLLETRNLLRRRPDVRKMVREGYDQLLVDEFQDTDAVQCDILRMLALEGNPRPGLFLVGDPKQSIYGWRSADLKAFEDFVKEVEFQGGQKHPLRINFRSVPVILEEVERICRPVMPYVPGIQPPFEPLVPAIHNENATGFTAVPYAPVEHQVSWFWQDAPIKDPRTEEATGLEARSLARELRNLHDEHQVPWKEMAILMRATNDVDDYAGALREVGIPYAVTRDRSYYQRREIIDAAALVRCILDPLDHVALVATLRSPLCGVPDGALIPLWTQRLPQLLSELHHQDPIRLGVIAEKVRAVAAALPSDIPGIERVTGWEEATLATLTAISALRASYAKEAPDLWVEHLRQSLQLDASEAARYQGLWRLANLDRFLRLLLVALEEGIGDEQEVLRALRKGVAEEKEAAEGRPMDASEDVVKLMTIHKSKGLDFGHVYVVQHNKKSRANRLPTFDYAEVKNGDEYVLFGAFTLGYPEVLARRKQVEAAERVRLLYVALTRAKVRVVTMGVWGEPASIAFAEANTFGDLLKNRADIPDLADLMRAAVDGATTYMDAGHARWRYLALEERKTPRAAPTTAVHDPILPTLMEISAMSTQLQTHKQTAHERMKLSLGGEFHTDGAETEIPVIGPGSPRARLHKTRIEPLMRVIGDSSRRLLSEWNLHAPVDAELPRLRRRLEVLMRERVDDHDLAGALAGAGLILERFAKGPFPARLMALEGLVRGVPLLMSPSVREAAYRSSSMDILYEDQGALILGLWRLEEPADPADANAMASRMLAPMGTLLSAAEQALGRRPRLEFWYLLADHVSRP